MPNGFGIENYYETLLENAIRAEGIGERYTPDTLADFRCTVLNQLPARYIRFRVDLAFHQSADEARTMERKLNDAIAVAHGLIARRKAG